MLLAYRYRVGAGDLCKRLRGTQAAERPVQNSVAFVSVDARESAQERAGLAADRRRLGGSLPERANEGDEHLR